MESSLHLLPHQQDHFSRLLDKCMTGKGYLDTSTTGCGKTYVTCFLAKILNLRLLVVCPKTVKAVWKGIANEIDVPLIQTITFQSLSSKLRKQPKHNLLIKITSVDSKGRDHHEFRGSELYKKYLAKGILFVVDELQFVRNNTAQYRSVKAMIHEIVQSKPDNVSRFGLLSASPFDKASQAINVIKAVGIVKQPELFMRGRPTGWIELLQYCKKQNPSLTDSILSKKPSSRKQEIYKEVAFELYVRVVRPTLCSAMPFPEMDKDKISYDAKNGFYTIQKSKKKDFEMALFLLESAATKVKDPTKPRTKGDCLFAELTLAMMAIEKLKWDIFERLVKKELENDPSTKVVVGVHYLDTLYELEHRLQDYQPLLLHGKVEEEEREDIIEAFQKDATERLLLCISRVGGVGISLHDQEGSMPRCAFMSPTFNLIEAHQFAGRFYRVGTKSPVKLRIVYGNVGNREKSIQDILIRKSKVLRNILEECTRNNIVLPIDYEEYYESEIEE